MSRGWIQITSAPGQLLFLSVCRSVQCRVRQSPETGAWDAESEYAAGIGMIERLEVDCADGIPRYHDSGGRGDKTIQHGTLHLSTEYGQVKAESVWGAEILAGAALRNT